MKTSERMYFLDNLRTFVVFLVVLCHAGGVYESSGIWASFWIVDDPATNDLSGLLNIILDIFMMPTLFFISGYLAPASLKSRSGWAFVRAKCSRLLLPWSIALVTLIPLYKVIFLFSRNLPQEHWSTYFHFSNGIISQSWLWFLPVLFGFNILYLLFARIGIRVPDISVKGAVCGASLVGFAYSLGMDMLGLRGWAKIGVLDFQNERLLIYLLAFLLGALCFRRRVFDGKPESRALYILVNAIAWIPVTVYISLLLFPWLHPGKCIVSPAIDRVMLWLCFHLSLLCLVYVTVETFRRYLDKPGRLRNELGRNSYYVYIIHVIVMGSLALIMLDTPIPSLLKFLLLTVSTFAVSNLIIYSWRKLITSHMVNNRMEESTMKTVTAAMLLAMLLTAAGCGKQKSPDQEERPPRVSLHRAALQGNLDAVRQHISAGSDLNEKDAYGSSPLIVAATFGRTEVARALIDAGADLRVANNEGSTPLHIAAFLCRTEIVKALLDKGADKNALNHAGRTALESVSRPFDEVKGIYDGLRATLEPLGLRLDYERIERTRPRIAQMLR